MSYTSTSEGAEGVDADDPSSGFEHVVVESDGRPAECTIFPSECPEADILTNWVTAQGNAFVSLEDTL